MLTAAFGKAAVMANEDKKDFNAMLNDSKDMPKIQIITDEKSIKKYGGKAVSVVKFLQNKCTRNSIFRVHFSFIRIPPSAPSVKQIAKIS